MFKSFFKKYSICIAFLLLFFLVGCAQKNVEKTTKESSSASVSKVEKTTQETSQAPVSLDGTWKVHNIRETLERFAIYQNFKEDGGLKLVNLLSSLINAELTINGTDVQYHIAYDNTEVLKLDYEVSGSYNYDSFDEYIQHLQMTKDYLSKLPNSSGGYNEDMTAVDLTMNGGVLNPNKGTISFERALWFTPNFFLIPDPAGTSPIYEYTIDGDILTLKISGYDKWEENNKYYFIQFKKE